MGTLVLVVLLALTGVVTLVLGRFSVQARGETRRVSVRPVGIGLLVVATVILAFACTVTVGATDVGIPVTFGRVGQSLRPGFHLKAPWTSITSFSTRLQESDMTQVTSEGDRERADGVEVLSAEGGRLVIDVTIKYTVDVDEAPNLFRQVGSMEAIRERLVRPHTRSIIRDVYAARTAEEAYSTERVETAAEVQDTLRERLAPRGVNVDSVNIRDLQLDERLQQALNQKLETEAAAERALIDQQRAEAEAETARITAEGRADANLIEAESLTPELLRAREIEAIRTNPNVVLYPFGQPITPIITTGDAAVPGAEPAP